MFLFEGVCRYLQIVVVLFCSALMLIGCAEEQPVKIGFVGGLTGRVAGLGVAGRDGALMAVDEQNQRGGVAGRPLTLVIKDDKQDPETARRVVGELIDEDVVAIVGHMTSSMSVQTQALINEAGVVMLSPTTKTDLLSGQDDHFLRVTPQLSVNAAKLAEYVVKQRGLKHFAVVYDKNNSAFTETWLTTFSHNLQTYSAEVVVAIPFAANNDLSFLEISRKMLENNPDGLLILANAMDSALVAQQIRKLGSDLPLFTSEWSFTSDVINFGGSAVEGTTSFHTFDAKSEDPHYLAFAQVFQQRYGYPPSFATVLAYDATSFLIAGLDKNPRKEGLKKQLLSIEKFHGLQSDFHLNRHGDVERSLFLTVIREGRFTVIEQP
jgi:branched-chain amino acid transport system substrate-binding protein